MSEFKSDSVRTLRRSLSLLQLHLLLLQHLYTPDTSHRIFDSPHSGPDWLKENPVTFVQT